MGFFDFLKVARAQIEGMFARRLAGLEVYVNRTIAQRLARRTTTRFRAKRLAETQVVRRTDMKLPSAWDPDGLSEHLARQKRQISASPFVSPPPTFNKYTAMALCGAPLGGIVATAQAFSETKLGRSLTDNSTSLIFKLMEIIYSLYQPVPTTNTPLLQIGYLPKH